MNFRHEMSNSNLFFASFPSSTSFTISTFGCLLILIELVSCSKLVFSLDDNVVFENPNANKDEVFEKMAIDPSTTRIFIGGVNGIYDLTSDDLSVRKFVQTGPVDDSPNCRDARNRPSCKHSLSKTSSHTKALAIYDKSSKLIECSNLYQGRCRLRNLHNISEILGESVEPRVSNDTHSSVVVFVGSGPVNLTTEPVLYIGSTIGDTEYDRSSVSSVVLKQNSRFKEPFEYVSKDFYAGTYVSLDWKSKNSKYRIDYIGGFESGDYAYFATRQRKNLEDTAPVQSRLVRVCTGDKWFHSYTEVPLICKANGREYNLIQDVYVAQAGYELAKNMGISVNDPVMYAIFWEGDKQSTGRSAICIYTLKKIEAVFKQNIMNCYKGTKGLKKNLKWFSSNDDCRLTTLPWESVKCGKDVNSKIGGTDPIETTATLTIDEELTSVAVNTTRSSTVLFVGTNLGKLHKILIDHHTTAEIFATEQLTDNNEPILADMEFSENGKFIYILTPSKVIKMATSKCEALGNECDVCLQKRDPYCGWCITNNHCTQEETCEREVPHTSSGWLDFLNSKCPKIRSIKPEKLQYNTADYLNVTIENLFASKGKRLRCLFTFESGEIIPSDPVAFDGSLKCATPPMEKLPKIKKNEFHLQSKVVIVADGSQLALASTNFSFYDCSRYTSCSKCAASEFPCDWCLESNECVAGKLTEDKCRKQHIVNGLNRDGSSSRKGPSKCPHIVAPVSKMSVAVGEKKKISVKVENVDSTVMNDFRCVFQFRSVSHEKLATREADDTITCEEMLFDSFDNSQSDGSTTYDFNIVWTSSMSRQAHRIDNVENLSIDVYSCAKLATNCGKCLTVNADKYECGWCGGGGQDRCTRPHQCVASTRRGGSVSEWLNSSQLCPNPIIEDFHPKKGTTAGQTRVTITGVNLGRRFKDVERAVQIANVACEVIEEEYVASEKIVCITGKSPVKGAKNRGVVAVTLRHDSPKFFATSSEHFAYVEPTVSSLKPVKGPKSGGTDVTLTGVDLDTGSEVRVVFGDVQCKVLARSSSTLTCRMSPSSETGSFPLRIFFDEAQQKLLIPINFEFTSDPMVLSIAPNKTVASGGINIDVYGQGFSLLQRPRMVFIGASDEKSFGPPCTIITDQFMNCSTPILTFKSNDRHRDDERIADYAFDFDGAELHQSRMKVMPSPTLEVFGETRFIRPGDDSLTLNGRNLNLVASERDITVTVGGEPCPLTALANKVLTCRPPSRKPQSIGSLEPEVLVSVGNSKYTIGIVSYDSPGLSSSFFMSILIVAAILILLIIGMIVYYRRKTNSHQRQMKYLKTQMDTIEMKVATECKEAFAELQTSLNQYTADLPLGTPTAPFLEYKEYCARVLFPNSTKNHPVLKNLEVDTHKAEAIEAGLREFHKLLMNKTFFLTMVRTMEANKYFVGKDRVYVGSLLMVVLQEKMGYCTEMLKQLLRELIEKTVEKKFQPKILFRRSESVAERMLAAWFTFLLHDHLRNYDAGKKLYELYWGIKQQMEKGPQDAITLEARYSLSEEKLLRATFEYKEMIVFVSSTDSVYSQADIPVRVLDCDTISQVKEKCLDVKYRGYCYSERPSASDMELEWKTGLNGRMILQDSDASSKVEFGNWKKLNTLAHYNVPNNAILALTSKSNSLYNLSILSERSEKSSLSLKNVAGSGAAAASAAAGLNSPKPWGGVDKSTSDGTTTQDGDGGYKLYHLVKPTEHGPTDNQEKMVTEIYLTRLLMMKGTLQKFINDMLESIFSTRTSPLPACIKYMFDFMDEQALENGINDPEVVHAWKSNALPLRFWVNLIKNPHFLFDIQKPTKVEGCLSVVAQTLMDACSTQDHQLTKDSPSSKLLFAKDMYQYREWVDSYYTEVAQMPPVDDQVMLQLLSTESRQHNGEFQVFSALNELYKYLDQYKESIIDALESNEHAQTSRLPGRLQDLLALMESDYYRATDYESSTLGLGYNSNSRLMPKERI